MAHIPFLSHYLERKNIEYQNQLLARQVEEVQNIYLTMRGWRHGAMITTIICSQ